MNRSVLVLFTIQFLLLFFTVEAQVSPVDSLATGGDSAISAPIQPAPTTGKRKVAPLTLSVDTPVTDSLKALLAAGEDSLLRGDSLASGLPSDTGKTTQKDPEKEKSDLSAPVNYEAKDSIVFMMNSKDLFLYKAAKIVYEKIELTADSISANFSTNIIHAAGKKDKDGQITGRPEFKDGDQPYKAERISYNFKTRKGSVIMARTQQGSEYVLGDKVKMAGLNEDGKDVIYIKNGKFTSCDLEHPHFYIKSSKLKIIPDDRIISGPLFMVIGDVPFPVPLPFGFFPNTTGKKSGILLPTYGEAADRGFFLKDLGYYFAISDFIDLALRGDIYTKGGWRAQAAVRYKMRYRLDGNFSFDVARAIIGEKIDPSFQDRFNFNVVWRHNQTINPSTKFNANVNIATSTFLAQNSYNTDDIFTTNLNSSVTLQKSFRKLPYSLTAGLTHNQNTRNKTMTLGLPNISLNGRRINPLKSLIKRKKEKWTWLTNLYFTHSLAAVNTVTMPDSLVTKMLFNPLNEITYIEVNGEDTTFTTKRGIDYFRSGIRQTVPVGTNITIAKYFNLTPSFNYTELWYMSKREKIWVPDVTDTINGGMVEETDRYGFYTRRHFNFRADFSTQIFGFYTLTKSKREVNVRHTITPTVGYNFTPDFSASRYGFYDIVQTNDKGEATSFTDYSLFPTAPYGIGQKGMNQSINYNINNRLELKRLKKPAKGDTSTTKQYENFMLFDEISASGSYNFAAEKFKLSDFTFRLRSNPFQNYLNFQARTVFSPYDYDSLGVKLDQFLITSAKKKLLRLTTLDITLSSSLRGKKRNDKGPRKIYSNPEIQYYANQYVDFNVPWSLNFTYRLLYTNYGIRSDTTMTINLTGDVSLTPKWKIGVTTAFDLMTMEFIRPTISVHRDLHCWQMDFRWTPFGPQQSFLFTLNIVSPTFKDIKLQKQSDFRDRAF